RFGHEALTIAGTLGDRSIEVVATSFLGRTHFIRGEFTQAVALLERNVALEGDLCSERFGTSVNLSALSEAWLSHVLSELGRFDPAIEYAGSAVKVAEAANVTLYLGFFAVGLAYLGEISGARPRSSSGASISAARGSSPTGHHSPPQPWASCMRTPTVLTRRSPWSWAPSKGFTGARFTSCRRYPVCAGMISLSVGRIDEAADYAREALALTQRLGLEERKGTPFASAVTSRRQAATRTLKAAFARRWCSPSLAACVRSLPTATRQDASPRGQSPVRLRSTSLSRRRCTAKWA